MKSSFPYPKVNRRLLLSPEDQIVNDLKQRITNRELAHRYPIPSILEMATELHVEPEIVKKAYHRLMDEQLILLTEPNQYYVNFQSLPSTYYTKLFTIFEVIKDNHMTPVMETVHKEVIPSSHYPFSPNPWATNDKLLHMSRVYKGNGVPIVYLEAYFPLSLFPNIENLDFSRFALYRITDEFYEHPIARYRHRIHSLPLPAHAARYLNSEEGAASLSTIAHAYDAKNQLLYTSMDYAYSHYSYQQIIEKVDFPTALD